MKQHVHMFESFISHEGPSSREMSWRSDDRSMTREDDDIEKRAVAAKTAKLIGELTRLSNSLDMKDPVVRADISEFMQKYLGGRGVSDEDTDIFLRILSKLSFRSMDEKKKIDQDGDGDTDFVDAKVAQYTKGGIPKDQAISKAKVFAKKNSIKDAKRQTK